MPPDGEAWHDPQGQLHPTNKGEAVTHLNLNQLSAKLGGRSRSSLYRDVESGRIPEPIRIGSRLYWIESQVDDALTADHNEAA